MSDESVRVMLKTLREAGDPRLPQYIIAIHKPDGWTLTEIGAAMGVSRERARQLEVRGYQQIRDEDYKDLSELPTYTRRSHKRMVAVASALTPEVRDLVRSMYADTAGYRRGHDREPVERLLRVVKALLDAGVPMNEIARAAGQQERSFRDRMKRHGVVSPHRDAVDTMSNAAKEEAKKKADRKVLSTEESTPQKPCKWPDCPSRTGTGPCVHR